MSMAVIRIALAHPAISRNQPFLHVPHSLAGTGEVQQGKHGERKLQRQHHLAESQQVGDTAVAAQADDQHRRQNRQVRVISRRTQGWMRQRMKPSITTCPASVPVMVLLWPLASKRDRKQCAGERRAQQRRQGQISHPNPVAIRR